MDIQQPATLAESRKAPIVVGSGDWLDGERAMCYKCGKEAKIIRPEHLPGMWRFKGHRNKHGKTCATGEYHNKPPQ